MMYRTDKHRRIVESLRVMLAIIAGLLMLDERQEGRQELSIAVIAFSIYAITLLWQAANGSLNAQRRVRGGPARHGDRRPHGVAHLRVPRSLGRARGNGEPLERVDRQR